MEGSSVQTKRDQELEAIFETLATGLAVYNPNGNIVRTNAILRSLLGIDPMLADSSILINQRVEELLLQDEQRQKLTSEEWPARRILNGEILTGRDAVDIGIVTLDGRNVYLATSGAPLRDKSGSIVGGVLLYHDVTERYQREQRLLEESLRMEEFLSIASHELRTPLTTINGNIQLAKRRLKMLITSQEVGEEQANKLDFVQELLDRAERQVRVQNRLVSDLLDVSRIQSNRLELHMTHCDLAEIVYEAVADQRSAFPLRMISLDLPYATAIPIEADKDRIGQAFTHYLTNALKYSSPESPVEVRVEIEPGQARVQICDEGPGIALEEQERIWQRFYHVPNKATRAGLGLGLHICKTIIERHKGQVGVLSAPNEGSTFWFTLPVIDPVTFIES